MSAETEHKNETESKLLENSNERDIKSYGTEGTDIIARAEQRSTHDHDQEAGAAEGKIRAQRNKSLFNRVRTFQTNDTHVGFLNKIVSFIFDTIAGIIALLIANMVQVACIIIGSVYINDCPASHGIPIILIVNGGINVLICIMESTKRKINRNSDIMSKLGFIMTILKIASLISFCSWIFIVYDTDYPNYDNTNDPKYCNKTVFLFAFWLLNVYLILMLIILFVTCCCCCFATSTVANDKSSA